GGAVLFDGRDLREVELASLRAQVALVAQETFLFNDTVRANIAYGRPDVSHEKIVEVARAARAHEFIEKLPRGYDTEVGERGCTRCNSRRSAPRRRGSRPMLRRLPQARGRARPDVEADAAHGRPGKEEDAPFVPLARGGHDPSRRAQARRAGARSLPERRPPA